jgi:hypothetical protein
VEEESQRTMTAKSVPVAGIDTFIARNISFKLRHDPSLSSTSTLTIQLLQKSVDLINYEMLRIFREIAQEIPYKYLLSRTNSFLINYETLFL